MERYSVTELRKSYKPILQWLKALKLIETSVASVDSRKINVVKCTIYFKKTLSEKYQNVGIKVLRREFLRKNAIMYFNE